MSFELDDRYLVLKLDDIEKGLDSYDKKQLSMITRKITKYRRDCHKCQRTYLVTSRGTPEYDSAFKILEEKECT